MIRAVVLAATLLFGGCAYYNGLYNANRLADEARRAEREGRTGEARSLWSRAAVKAESVAVRFPDSRWYDDALLLWGRSLARVDACSRAVRPLAVVSDSSRDDAIVQEARFLLADCRLFMREPDSAVVALNPLVARGGPRLADALALRARAHLAAGRPGAALADAEATDAPGAAFTRAAALAQLGRGLESAEVLATLVDGPYTEAAWRPVLASLAASAPEAATDLVTRLAARDDLTVGQRGRLLLADAERRLASGHVAAARPLLERAAAMARDSVEGRAAEAHLFMLRLDTLADPDALPALLADVRRVTEAGGRPVQIAGRVLTVIPRVLRARETPDEPARLFLAAEAVRDTLGARPLAAALFLETARMAGDGLLAPKALLAAAVLRPGLTDSATAVLAARFPQSVYTLALRGEAGERYRAVEDSLRQVFAALARETAPPGPARRNR